MDDDTKIGDVFDGAVSDDDEPTGADPDGSVDTAHPEELPELDSDMMVVDPDTSCDDCVHQDVCAVYGNFREQVSEGIPQRTGGEPAFEPEDLAIICDHYRASD